MDANELEIPIHVTSHAVKRAQERLGFRGDFDAVRRRVATEVRVGLLLGRVQASAPPYVHGAAIDPGARYVRDRLATRAWVIYGAARVTVKTVLTDRAEYSERTLRRGLVRA